ncbi:MAG: ParA family protein [Clostridia bacterium]|nr:ParA family protein [Clostridia bacterium]
MGKIIAITNQKGGVGKTTTSVNLSAVLADLGQKTLMIDLDPQGNATSGLGLEAGKKSVYEVLMDSCSMADVIEKSDWDRLSVAPSDIRLAGAELELVDVENREYQLKYRLKEIRDSYDFIVIDCPPSLGLLTLNALAAADAVLIPIQCEYYALEGVSSLMSTIQRVRRAINTHLEIEGVLLTMLDGRTNLGLQVVDQVKKHFKKQVYATTIPRSVRLGEAPSHGEPINVYDPRSAGAVAYRALGEEVLKRNGIKVKKKA